MHVPDPVISLAVSVPDRGHTAAFSKAIARFQKEDPTFRVHVDPESNEVRKREEQEKENTSSDEAGEKEGKKKQKADKRGED